MILDKSLKWVLYIHYPTYFWKQFYNIKALIDFDSEVNIINLALAKQLGLKSRLIDVKA